MLRNLLRERTVSVGDDQEFGGSVFAVFPGLLQEAE